MVSCDIATSADGALDVHIADIDGDGDLDIVSAAYKIPTIGWYENDGAANPTFTASRYSNKCRNSHESKIG